MSILIHQLFLQPAWNCTALIKYYFTTTGWLSVLRIVKRVEELGWICKVCQEAGNNLTGIASQLATHSGITRDTLLVLCRKKTATHLYNSSHRRMHERCKRVAPQGHIRVPNAAATSEHKFLTCRRVCQECV